MVVRKILPTERDFHILEFLWRWKLVTSSALIARFFPDKEIHTAYRRLWTLRRAGYTTLVSLAGERRFAWALTSKGFQLLLPLLPAMKDVGFKAEAPDHDFIASAVHLGGWLNSIPPAAGLFSEQELRRLDPEHYPAWVPRTQLRRPDGYWRVPMGNAAVTIALEVELSRKKASHYEILADFYESQESIYRVVWVVKTQDQIRNIAAAMRRRIQSRALLHCFLWLSDYLDTGWNTTFRAGYERGRTLGALLFNCPTTPPQHVVGHRLLDTRIMPRESVVCAAGSQSLGRYRPGYSPSRPVLPTSAIEKESL